MQSTPWSTVVLLAAVCASSCAGRQARPAREAGRDATDLARAQALIDQGCYRCLEEALTIARLLAAQSLEARGAAFDAALLLAARDRELGMLAVDHLPAARGLASTPRRDDLLLSIVDAMPWPQAAQGPSERDRSLLSWRTLQPVVAGWHAALSELAPRDLPARYTLEGLECTWTNLIPGALNDDGTPAPPHRHGDEPAPQIVQFRRMLCARPPLEEIVAMREQLPRYAELELLAGDAAMNGGALLTAERHYQDALRAFPAMLPAAHGLARLHVMLEEYEASLSEYDLVLAAIPDQQDCLLGKARALSQLGRYTDAMPLLDRLIGLGTWLVGDAHYWRGWDRLQVGDVDGAAADTERALQLMMNARVHVLAGAVAARKNDWDRAGREFETAQPLDETDCDIPVSLGSVRGQQRDWPSTFTAYATAAECLVASQAQLARRVQEITVAPMDPARRVRFLARAEAAVAAAHRQEGQARYNAAVSLLNLGRRAEAAQWAAQAAGWSEWRERADSLLSDRKP